MSRALDTGYDLSRYRRPFPDPSKAEGTMDEKKAYVRPIMEKIRSKAAEFCDLVRKGEID